MSYSRSFSKTISVHYSGTAHTSVTVNGQSTSVSVPYSGTVHEVVTVNVHVDTDPFDRSVSDCNTNVGVLTGAVVATEAAQVASLRENSIKVGNTIVNGFFSTVRSEISQQIAELKIQIDALLLHLREMAKRCQDKQRQMQVDYQRIAERYIKIFDDLNNELENRIYEVDRPVFQFKRESDDYAYQALCNDLATTSTVTASENAHLVGTISASLAKKQAFDTLNVTNDFLTRQKQNDNIIHHCILDEDHKGEYYAPVCYIETTQEGDITDRNIYHSDMVAGEADGKILDSLSKTSIDPISDDDVKNIKVHFNQQLDSQYPSTSEHEERVREYITKMFNNTIHQ